MSTLAAGTGWTDVLNQAIAATPEAFVDGRPRNLIEGSWQTVGAPAPVRTPVDGTVLIDLPRLDADARPRAVAHAAAAHREWAATPLAERKARVAAALDALTDAPRPARPAAGLGDRQAVAAGLRRRGPGPGRRALVRRARSTGMRRAAASRCAGPVSNIASWNYPMSVLVHAELVQLLAGNAVDREDPVPGRRASA